VGLADALVHDPELLIVDEPTIGLDPNQIRSVRQLIKDLANKHTVLVSSHILPEVEATCGRVLILGNGKILAADTPDNLQQVLSAESQVIAEIAAPAHALKECFEALPEIERFEILTAGEEYQRCAFTARAGMDVRPQVFQMVQKRGWKLRELTRNRYSLEDIFVQLTRPDREEES
jgi:ABC-2 type transport system ATP-binding protein